MNKNIEKNDFTEIKLNELDEESLIECLNDNLDLIKKIENPSVRVQKIIVKKEINYFRYILNPDISVIKYVAKLKPSLLREDMFDIEDIQKILMMKNPRYARKFTKMSESIKSEVAKYIPSLLSYENNDYLQRLAFSNNCLSIKYFKDCCLLDIERIMYRCPGAICKYVDNVDNELVYKYIEGISSIFYGKIKEYNKDILKYILTYNISESKYLDCNKMLKVENIQDIMSEMYPSKLSYFVYKSPYNLVKNMIARYPKLSLTVKFENENEMLDAINSNCEVIKYLPVVPEEVLLKLSPDVYSSVFSFGEVSLKTQEKLLEYDIKNAGKIKNLDLSVAKRFAIYDSSILRYLRVMDDELMMYGIIFGIVKPNEFIKIDKDKLANMLFMLEQLNEEEFFND